MNQEKTDRRVCLKNHQDQYVACSNKVVYSPLLSYGMEYIGQTGRCLNERMKEHKHQHSGTGVPFLP